MILPKFSAAKEATMSKFNPTKEQKQVLENKSKNLIVSASAGSGKTSVLIEYIKNLICTQKVSVKRLLVLTFTKAAAGEMRERLNKAILSEGQSKFLAQQIDDLSISDISTIDSFCEKIIKRNLESTQLDQDFQILDNERSDTYKRKAFDRAIEEFSEDEDYQKIYFAFRRNKDSIFEAMEYLYNFFSSQNDSQKLINKITNQQNEFYQKAVKYLDQYLTEQLSSIDKFLIKALEETEGKYNECAIKIENIFTSKKTNGDFFDRAAALSDLELPRLPSLTGENKDENQAKLLSDVKDKIGKIQKFCDKFVVEDEKLEKSAQNGELAIALTKLYIVFLENYKKIKDQVDGLDFADIEKLCKKLLEKDEILTSIQEKYDYIFIDEYQDTNSLQESIVKPIASKGKFIAVGDLKQGIYGFRNASMEIMQKDIQDFSSSLDSDAFFLKGNFRSDSGVLNFVNRVFEKIMTEDEVGVDYKSTSMLEGLAPYKKQDFPSVRVDIIKDQKEKKKVRNEVYSVQDDEIYIAEKNKAEVQAIVARIDDLIGKKIYDLKLEAFRSILPSDITVLFRNRSSLMSELALNLQKKGYPVICESKFDITKEPEVAMLANLISLSINFEDDIALASVMASYLGGFDLNELTAFQQQNESEHLFEFVRSSGLEKVVAFRKEIEKFSKNCQVMGVSKALEKMFAEKDYFAYLAFQEDGEERTHKVQAFLSDISSSGFDYDRASLVEYFKTLGQKAHAGIGGEGNSINLTTIHASKGLEYPVVILAGSGEKLEKIYNKQYILSQNFGLGTIAFNSDNNLKCTTPVFEAIKLENKKREFIDELMIFYVALTRAKNHLYVVGKEGDFEGDLFDRKTYLSLILYAFGENFKAKLLSEGQVQKDEWEFNIVSESEEIQIQRDTSLLYKPDENMIQKIEEYLSFVYPHSEECKMSLKNSVTGILNLENEAEEFVYETNSNVLRDDAIMQGNAHHEALKKIDFEKIENMESLENELKNAKIKQEYVEKLDKKILLENILTLKKVAKGKLLKEKEFIMKAKIKEIFSSKSDDEVLLQGAVDLLCLGEENILIDYKFTNQKNKEKIIKKYKKQIELYSLAIEKAFKIKLNKKYIFSLKNNDLIEIF